jgi:hypothetical protein
MPSAALYKALGRLEQFGRGAERALADDAVPNRRYRTGSPP